MQQSVFTSRIAKRLRFSRSLSLAFGMTAALASGWLGQGNTAVAGELDRIVVSGGKTVASAQAPKSVSAFRGRVETASELAPADQLAEFRAVGETAQDMARLLALQTVGAGKGQESIIGPDSRVRVTPTTTFPARATVLITFSLGRCTGWLIGPNTVITAGHCVHPGSGGPFYPVSSYRIYPGRNGGGSPYGSCTAKWLASVNGWTTTGDDRYDYGAIKLNCAIGNTVGWYGYFVQAGSLNGLPTNINGYPGDKPLTQWRSSDKVRVTQPQRVFYQNDTVGGMSGSPVWYNRTGCGACAMAIHAYGVYGSPPFSNNNHGTRITQAVANNLTAWKNAP